MRINNKRHDNDDNQEYGDTINGARMISLPVVQHGSVANFHFLTSSIGQAEAAGLHDLGFALRQVPKQFCALKSTHKIV